MLFGTTLGKKSKCELSYCINIA